MIQRIYINNFILIDDLTLDFDTGMTVLTGETGAGKSILLGALGAALGNRLASKGLIKDSKKKAVIEITVSIEESFKEAFESRDFDFDTSTVFRRELLPSGKSRGFINDTPAKSSDLNYFASFFIDINSQSDSRLFNETVAQLSLIDTFEPLEVELAAYEAAYKGWTSTKKELDVLSSSQERNDLDYLEFLYHELDKANIKRGELDDIESTLSRVKGDFKYKEGLESSVRLISFDHGLMDTIYSLESELEKLSAIDESLEDQLHEVQDIIPKLQILERSLQSKLNQSSMEVDVDELQSRASRIRSLVTKHRVLHSDELVDKFEAIANDIAAIHSRSNRIDELQENLKSWEARMKETGDLLHEKRVCAGVKIQTEVQKNLEQVDLGKARFELRWSTTSPKAFGTYKPEFYFSANPGTPLELLNKVASGGESSRLKLALKAALGMHSKLSCQIFDEIDTGISGSTAQKVGATMKRLSGNQQIITITHLPQVAAYGSAHWKVVKTQLDNETSTSVEILNDSSRISEIARMLSGEVITNEALKQAEVLLYQ